MKFKTFCGGQMKNMKYLVGLLALILLAVFCVLLSLLVFGNVKKDEAFFMKEMPFMLDSGYLSAKIAPTHEPRWFDVRIINQSEEAVEIVRPDLQRSLFFVLEMDGRPLTRSPWAHLSHTPAVETIKIWPGDYYGMEVEIDSTFPTQNGAAYLSCTLDLGELLSPNSMKNSDVALQTNLLGVDLMQFR